MSKIRSILNGTEVFEKHWLEELKDKHLELIEKNFDLISGNQENKIFLSWVREFRSSKKNMFRSRYYFSN